MQIISKIERGQIVHSSHIGLLVLDIHIFVGIVPLFVTGHFPNQDWIGCCAGTAMQPTPTLSQFTIMNQLKEIITVSIVDNEFDLCKCIASYLDNAGNIRCISTYTSAKEALAHLPQDKPNVILMDINLEEMDGIECVRRLTALLPTAQVLIFTVFEDSAWIFHALAAGASGYLLKRLSPKKLLEAIEEVHTGGSPMSAPIARKIIQSFRVAPVRGGETTELTPYELSALNGLARGLRYKEIANELNVSINTVRNHIRRTYEKLHVSRGPAAVAKSLQNGVSIH
jgi:DNA-binding NarL/FixJ family response regulator